MIWVTGRAAAGKSALITALDAQLREHRFSPVLFSDEELLLALKRTDTAHRHHCHPYGDHRVAWRTGYLFDESLRILNAHLLRELDRGGLGVVELARGRHAPPIDATYRRALQLFDRCLWPHSTVFRLDVTFDVQMARNTGRTMGTGHGTPDAIMRSLYIDDDPESFIDAGIPIITLPASVQPHTNAAQMIATLHMEPSVHNM